MEEASNVTFLRLVRLHAAQVHSVTVRPHNESVHLDSGRFSTSLAGIYLQRGDHTGEHQVIHYKVLQTNRLPFWLSSQVTKDCDLALSEVLPSIHPGLDSVWSYFMISNCEISHECP